MTRGISIVCIAVAWVFISCGKKISHERQRINNPENGYIQEIKTDLYKIKVQYQTPAYRADQEIMLNKSTSKKNDLIEEYDQLQQFLVQLSVDKKEYELEELGLMDKFSLVLTDTIPCIDVHAIPYSPGAPYREIILLFPISEKELGTEFKMVVTNFPLNQSFHEIQFNLNKKD